jgi:cytochrome c553
VIILKKTVLFLSLGLLLILLILAGCQQQGEISGKTKNGDKLTVDQLAEIQPGLGTVMVEVGNRWWWLFYAGDAGSWDLAAYQSKETKEIMEVGETTRPKRKPGLENFVDNSMKPVDDAITAKDKTVFKSAFTKATNACNGCHAAETDKEGNNFSFIKWKLPTEKPPFFDLNAK